MTISTDTPTYQAALVKNIAVGSFTGDGNVTDVTCGFVPRVVQLVNLTDRIQQLWTADMAATHTLNTAANGTVTDDTGTLVVAKGGAAADTFQGFEIAAAAAVNAKVYHYIAFG